MVRGGSWNNNANECRSSYRNRNHPIERNNNIGFRVSRRFPAFLPELCRRKPA
ncbi:MAG: hypothetical protein J5I94_19995 [Phaeodactylibacter sp.]|nr:hypothetical protein [Phaeodactylibacter sp.]